jgi:hypothetical protein
MNVSKEQTIQGQLGTKLRGIDANLPAKPIGGQVMLARLARLFTAHPDSVDETYFGHMAFAAWFASRLFAAGLAALIHAFLPFLFETTASRIIRELYERTHKRGGQANVQVGGLSRT